LDSRICSTRWVNYPNGIAGPPSDSSLFIPAGVAVDANGNLLWRTPGTAASCGFRRPSRSRQGTQHANLVLGQVNFTSTVTDASSQNLAGPWGLAILSDGSLAVSDVTHNRVCFSRSRPEEILRTFSARPTDRSKRFYVDCLRKLSQPIERTAAHGCGYFGPAVCCRHAQWPCADFPAGAVDPGRRAFGSGVGFRGLVRRME